MKKGISPLIAAVLLIAFAIAVAGILSGWFTGLVKSQSTQVGSQTEQSIECGYGGIRIQTDTIACNFTGSNDELNFSLENSGSINMYDFKVQVYVDDLVHTYTLKERTTNSKFTDSYPLKPDEIKSVFAAIGDNVTSKDADWIRVTTQCPGVNSGTIRDIDCTG